MRIKTEDMELLMAYVDREMPVTIDVKYEGQSLNGYVSFTFQDQEDRECQVRIYHDALNQRPDLIKSMKLDTRFKKAGT